MDIKKTTTTEQIRVINVILFDNTIINQDNRMQSRTSGRISKLCCTNNRRPLILVYAYVLHTPIKDTQFIIFIQCIGYYLSSTLQNIIYFSKKNVQNTCVVHKIVFSCIKTYIYV